MFKILTVLPTNTGPYPSSLWDHYFLVWKRLMAICPSNNFETTKYKTLEITCWAQPSAHCKFSRNHKKIHQKKALTVVPSIKLDQMSKLIQQLLLHCAERIHQHLASGVEAGFLPRGAVMGERRAQPLPSVQGSSEVYPRDKCRPRRPRPNQQPYFWLAGCCSWLSGGMSAGG